MGTPAVPAKKMTSTSSKKILCRLILPIIISSDAVAAYSNVHYRHVRKFGSISSRIRSNGAPSSLIFRQNGKNPNQNRHPLQRREGVRVSTTACKSTTSDDATTHRSIPDLQHMKLAASLARIGYGNTFPNPAVGCVLVRHHNGDSSLDDIIGSGFHPKAGMPHAEVFALLEACGHVEDGVAAARSVMGVVGDGDASGDVETLNSKVLGLFTTYKSEGGASKLFHNHFDDCNVTAYVTLEPCCHYGQTPPCALSLAASGIDRVVVGFRDPNPRVDGGGIQVLQNAGIGVHVLGQRSSNGEKTSSDEMEAAKDCSNLVNYFVKRIAPREDPVEKLEDVITGKKRRVLRSIAGRQKSANKMQQIPWPKEESVAEDDKKNSEFAEDVPLSSRFLESIDQALWDHEIVLLKLNKVVKKKKGAKIIGGRIAEILDAHVAQVIGHTALLYRPAFPPVLDLDELAEEDTANANSD